MPRSAIKRPRAAAILLTATTVGLVALPAQAHGLAQAGLRGGLLHPLSGPDHLLLLIGVGAAAASISPTLLLWGLGGGLAGGVYGSLGGGLPAAEIVAALAVSAVGMLVLYQQRTGRAPAPDFCGSLIAAAVAVHAMLHAQAISDHAASGMWWLGACGASTLVSFSSYALWKRVPEPWAQGLAGVLVVAGGWILLGPVG